MASVALRSQHSDCSVFVHDLSAAGARVEAQFAQFQPGDPVRLRLPFLPEERSGEVAWCAGRISGIRFHSPLDLPTFRFLAHAMQRDGQLPDAVSDAGTPPQKIAGENRGRERVEVAIAAQCRTPGGRRGFVAMIDLTKQGCCLFARDLVLKKGQQLSLQPEVLAPLRACVKWSQGSLSGVKFETALYPAVFEHLSQTHRWDMPATAKLAIEHRSAVPQSVHPELLKLIERAEAVHRDRGTVRDVMTTRPPLLGTRPGLSAQSRNQKLMSRFLE